MVVVDTANVHEGDLMRITFLRWLLMTSLMSLGALVIWVCGWFNLVWNNDITYISTAIIAFFMLMSVRCGIASWRYDWYGQKSSAEHAVEQGQFAAGTFTTLGMIGTVFGFMYMLPAFGYMDVNSPESMQAMIKDLVSGMSVALYTTFVGLISSLLLRCQTFNLSDALNKHSEDSEVMS